ncbi:MAG: hypothetical protein NZO58_00345 [Gemmataceae bacterium]|nr:hypothetical protein [Gemmataceae bacterium]
MYAPVLFLIALLSIDAPRARDTAKSTATLEPEAGDLSGYYVCKGQEAGGKIYHGIATISRKGDVYVVQWVIGSGSNFTGIGIRQGNTFSASWAMATERGLIRGVNTYRIEAVGGNPRLTGRWASLPGPAVLQSETLTFLRPMDDEE